MEIWEEGARRKRKRREGGRMGKWREGKEERNRNAVDARKQLGEDRHG